SYFVAARTACVCSSLDTRRRPHARYGRLVCLRRLVNYGQHQFLTIVDQFVCMLLFLRNEKHIEGNLFGPERHPSMAHATLSVKSYRQAICNTRNKASEACILC